MPGAGADGDRPYLSRVSLVFLNHERTAQNPVRMTVAEFLAWNPPTPQLWQLVDGEPQAMAPVSRTHGAIQCELGSLIRNHLAESGST